SRGLRNRVIKEYINNNPIVNTLTCPHPSGYYRNIPCLYCCYGNAEVVKIEKLTRYFICKFRRYKQQFRGIKNLAKNKIIPPKSESTVPLELSNSNNSDSEIESSESANSNNTVPHELLVHDNDITAIETLITALNDDTQSPAYDAINNDVAKPISETIAKNINDATSKLNIITKICTAVGDDHTSCNNEPLKNQAELKLFSSCLGLINLECPKQDFYQLGGKYNTFYKHSSMYGNVYFDMSRHNKINDAYWDEIEDDHGVKRYTDAKLKEIAKMYCTDGHGFHSWIFDLSQEHKDIPLQQKRDIIIKRIDYELALDDLFNNKPKATLQEVTELYKQYHP
ncbi:unnamed protein product, partial [Rotaria socialis]